ncbi:MAG TPA: T9SS type A sorting domain-containing protein [Bacteroidota bacterium]
MKRTSILITLLLITHFVKAQTTHRLAFASEGNAVELAVANTASIEATDVTVRVQSAPDWLKFISREQSINSIATGEEQSAMFSFSVDKSAPVGAGQMITFAITNSTGQSWMKDIRIVVAAPETFELFQNFPNPFNPSTTITYQLPTASRVTLKIFNLLGQEVATLVSAEQSAGHHQSVWDATRESSGLYVYQIEAKEMEGRGSVVRKTMVLLK